LNGLPVPVSVRLDYPRGGGPLFWHDPPLLEGELTSSPPHFPAHRCVATSVKRCLPKRGEPPCRAYPGDTTAEGWPIWVPFGPRWSNRTEKGV
jgi:hypothetical protein